MIHDIMAILFPQIKKCITCEKTVEGLLPLCKECENSIEYYVGECTCKNCGRYYHGNCNSIQLKEIMAVARYTGHWKQLIHKFKFNNQKYLAQGLADKMVERLADTKNQIDIITYIPITPQKDHQRGYDQSYLLAKHMAKTLKKPVVSTLIRKGTRPLQHTLPLNERKNNWQGEFQLKKDIDIKNKTILLLDDIYTTGNTLYHGKKILLKGNPAKIKIIVLAN